MTGASDRQPVAAAGVVCLRGEEVLLIQRATPPRQGEWSIPGGRIGFMEPAADAALRELREETGVDAELIGLIDVVDGVFPATPDEPASHYLLIDYAAAWRAGEPSPGDDSAAARFFSIEEALEIVSWDETRRVIRAARELARSASRAT